MGVKGQSGGKKGRSGRKSKADEMGLVSLLDECWTLAQRKECIRKLATLAGEGDMDAIKLLMAYTYGKPKESVDLNHHMKAMPVLNVVINGSPTPPTPRSGVSKSGE